MNTWNQFNQREKQSYTAEAFAKMIAHGTRAGLNPFKPDYIVGVIENSWLRKDGLKHFQAMTGLIVSPYYQLLRKDEAFEYSRENVTPKLFPRVRMKVAADVRELLATSDDCKAVALALTNNGTPSPDGNAWSAWTVRTFALENHCFKRKESL